MRVTWIVFLLLEVVVPSWSIASEEIKASGFSWGHDLHESVAGHEYSIAATVNFLNARYNGTFEAHEYTMLISGVSEGSERLGNVITIELSEGVFRVYRDSTFNAEYAPYPPNPSVPSSFTDGALYLYGDVSEFRVSFNPGNNHGSIFGIIDFTDGEALHLLPTSEIRNEYGLIGFFLFQDESVPAGFTGVAQLEMQHWIAFTVEGVTWSTIRTLYR